MLPLSHQDIGPWPFINHPWEFALPFKPDKTGFTKTFLGDQALLAPEEVSYTYGFAGNDVRKVAGQPSPAQVLDAEDNPIGQVLTCTTDMAIGRYGRQIFSISSPDKPEGFQPKGLSCGFIKVARPLELGQRVTLADSRRAIAVTIVDDIRPARTARIAIQKILSI